MASQDACIVTACKESWEGEFLPGTQNSNNCSGFVKAVLGKLGVPISKTANADGIVGELTKGWTSLKTGAEAAQKAAAGTLVIAGLKAGDHKPGRNNGHVVIVIAGELYKSKYPLCWSGSIGGAQSQGSKSVGEVWNRTDRDAVQYFAYATAVCGVGGGVPRRCNPNRWMSRITPARLLGVDAVVANAYEPGLIQ